MILKNIRPFIPSIVERIPNDIGFILIIFKSPFFFKIDACIAAPAATISSGLTVLFNFLLLKNSLSIFCIFGILDEPPTNIISLISSFFKFASFNNQTEIDFPIYQGEKELAKDNYFLNSFTIKGLRKAPAGDVQFNVKMELDENGILNVTANEINGILSGGMIIEGVNDLTKEQIEFFKKQEKELQK